MLLQLKNTASNDFIACIRLLDKHYTRHDVRYSMIFLNENV